MKNLKSRNALLVFFIFLFLLSTKIDFRFDEINPGSFVDDAEYYYHAQTIAVDYDLNYENQMPNTPYRNLNADNRDLVVPVHSIGVGIFAAPILFISNLISQYITLDSNISFNYFMYSLIPIAYLFIAILLLEKVLIMNQIKHSKFILYISILGSGVSYFAFERFSMSHVYEFFGTTLLLYLISIYEKNRKYFLEFIIPTLMFLALTIRWSNYFYFLLPLFFQYFISKSKNNLYNKPVFIFGFISGLILFLIHTKYLYGIYTLNPSDIFFQVEDRIEPDYYRFFDLSRFFENIIYVTKAFLIVNISQEFGMLYFSPVLFLGLISFVYFLIKKEFLKLFITLLIYFFPFFSTLVLNNPGYSYGYRYFYSTIPVFLLIFFVEFYNIKLLRKYIIYFSIFAFFSQLLFETTDYTVLSSDYIVNTFGLYTKYVNPNYLAGVFNSIFIFDAYLNIIFTSFVGVFIIKILSLLTDPILFIENFRPVEEDILHLIVNSLEFSWFKFFLMVLLYFLITLQILKKSNH